jgi:hypothetical protein
VSALLSKVVPRLFRWCGRRRRPPPKSERLLPEVLANFSELVRVFVRALVRPRDLEEELSSFSPRVDNLIKK